MKTTLKDYQSALAKSKMLMTLFSAVTLAFIAFTALAWIEGDMRDFIGDTMLACLSGLSTYFFFRECEHYEEMITIYKWRSESEDAE
ncbi:MAG: hypothetical protein D8B41_06280 [Porphyromonas sp.]|nr:MAG: hypothetical protein D8B41_06280 [Porphyromonas sp.]